MVLFPSLVQLVVADTAYPEMNRSAEEETDLGQEL